MMKRAALAGIVCVVFSGVAAAADLTGAWEISITSPRGTNTATAELRQDGEKLEGVLKGRRGERPLEGTAKGNEVRLWYTIRFEDNEMKITLSGERDGEAMKGKADFGGLAEGEWSARRGAAGDPRAGAGAAAEKIDVTGAWLFRVETPAGSGSPTFTFRQAGEVLTGQYKGYFGEAPVNGTVKGNKIEFSIKVTFEGQEVTIAYAGTVDKDTMKGAARMGEMGEATWTAKRQQSN